MARPVCAWLLLHASNQAYVKPINFLVCKDIDFRECTDHKFLNPGKTGLSLQLGMPLGQYMVPRGGTPWNSLESSAYPPVNKTMATSPF